MSTPHNDCPSIDELQQFVKGRFNLAATEKFAVHIESCPNCQTRIEELDETDASVDAAVGGSNRIAFVDESHCGRVLEAIAGGYKPPSSTSVPPHLGDYTLLEPLGQGGMGMVYRARHAELGTLTAVKILQPHRSGDQATIDRFEREMVAIGKLDHPNIVRALDAGEEDGQQYLVMEYIDGFDLGHVANANGPLAIADAAEVIRQAATGLSYVHLHGRVHRDIKPSNLILARDGTVKLMDLGLARVEEYPVEDSPDDADDILGGSTIDLTRTHQVMGTPEYMPPEQVTDSSHVDHRADIYSLGCTFYKLLTGQSPMASSESVTALQQLVQRVQTPTVPAHVKRPDVPKALSELLDRMLAKAPEDRPQSAEEIAKLLRPFAARAHLPELAVATDENLAASHSLAATRDDLSTANDDDSGSFVTTPSQPGTTPSQPSSNRNTQLAAAGAAALMVLAAIAIAFSNPSAGTGTVIVQAESPEVEKLLAAGAAQLVDGPREVPLTLGKIELAAGQYVVSSKTDSGLKFSQGVIDLGRNQQLVLSVTRSNTTQSVDQQEVPDAAPLGGDAGTSSDVAANEEPLSYEAINPILLIDPERDIRGNDWRLEDGALISAPDQPSMLMIPYQPPDHYRVELTATRLEGNESLQLGLVADDRPIILTIDAYPSEGFLSGLYQFEGTGMWGRSSRSHQGQLLPTGEPIPVVATLRRDGQRLSIEMVVGRTSVLSWRGSVSQATGVGSFPPTQPGCLFLANWTASIKVSDFRVVPLSGEGTTITFTDPLVNPQRAAAERVLWNGGAVSIVDEDGTPTRTPPTVVGGFELIRSFEGHTGSVKTVAVSPDGKLAASGSGWPSGDKTIRIWDIETGEQLHSLDHGANVLSLAFSPDGQRVVACGSSPQLTLWDVHSGNLRRMYVAEDATYFDQVSYTPDGTTIIVTTGRSEVVYAIDVETGEIVHRWDVGSSALSFAISPDSSRLAIGLDNPSVRVVDLKSGKTVQELEGIESELSGRFEKDTYSLDISRDGRQIAAAYKGNSIQVWDFASGRVVKDLRSPVYGTEQIKFTGDGQQLLVAGFDGITALVDVRSGQVLGTTPLIPGHSWSFALLPDGQRVLTGGGSKYENGFQSTGDYALRLWRMNIAPADPNQQPLPPQRPTTRIDRWAQIPAAPEILAVDGQASNWIGDHDVTALANLSSLKSLDLSSTRVTSLGLEQLGLLPNLISLSLSDSLLRDVPPELAASCPALTRLDLQNTLLSDSSVTAVNGFTHLTDLDLGGTRLTDDGLAQLEGLSELETLSLAGTSVRHWDQVTSQRFPRLSRLNVLGTSISKEQLDRLRERMPELEIVSGLDAIDVIALVDVQGDADTKFSEGRVWRKENGRLMTAERSRISLPVVLPAEFDVHMTASRIAAGNAPILGFALPGGRQFGVGFDHDPSHGYYTILHGIDAMVDQSSTVKVQGETFPLDATEPIEIEIRVRSKDQVADIQVLRNGIELLSWQGDETRLHQTNSFWKGPNPAQPWLAQFSGSIEIEKLIIDPVSGPVKAGLSDAVSRFADYPVLKLDLRDRDIDDAVLKELLNNQLPTNLTLQGPGITDASLDSIAANRQIQFLSLDATAISEPGIARLAEMPRLERIEFWKMPQITDEVTKHLVTMPSLKHVVFKTCGLYGPGLERLHNRPIAGVNLGNSAVNAEILERYILPFKELKVLDLAGSPIDDEAMAIFPKFADLRLLHLGYNQTWTGPGLEYLKKVPSLRQVNLDASAVNDESLKHLAGADPDSRTLHAQDRRQRRVNQDPRDADGPEIVECAANRFHVGRY